MDISCASWREAVASTIGVCGDGFQSGVGVHIDRGQAFVFALSYVGVGFLLEVAFQGIIHEKILGRFTEIWVSSKSLRFNICVNNC